MTHGKLTLFLDGACPLCSREARFLKRMNKRGTLAFEDTSAPNFDPKAHGLSADVDRVIHAALPDGSIISGLEVFRRAYAEIGLGWLLKPTGWPVLEPLCDRLYLAFARNRMKIGRFLGRKGAAACSLK